MGSYIVSSSRHSTSYQSDGDQGPVVNPILLQPIIPEQITPESAKQLVAAMTCRNLPLKRAYWHGDHWYHGKGWVGPRPEATTTGDSWGETTAMRLIKANFVSSNMIRQVGNRQNKAITGRQPLWTITPTRAVTPEAPLKDEEKQAIAEINAALVRWWDQRKLHRTLKALGAQLLWAERGCWRLFIPDDLADIARQGAKSLMEAFERFIFVEVPDPESVAVVEDPNTKRKVGIVLYADTTPGARGRFVAEISWVDENGVTHIRYTPNPDKNAKPEDLQWGGALPVYQVTREEVFITEQLVAQQNALNLTLTLLEKGTNENSFLERIFLNAQMPGKWKNNPDGTRTFVPAPYVTGGKRTTFMRGLDYKDQLGVTQIKDPTVTFRPPTDESELRLTADYWRARMLSEVTQDYVLMNADATASGEARSQARSDFINTTEDDRTQLDMAGTELLALGFTVACGIAGRTELASQYRIAFQCKPNYGPISVPERTQVQAEVEAGLRSKANGQQQIGIDDPDAEQTTINSQPDAQLNLSDRRADVVTKWKAAGLPMRAALKIAGVPDPEAEAIMALARTTVPEGELP